MSVIDDYIIKANKAIKSKDPVEIDSVAREIVSAFHAEIPNIAYYRGQRISGDGSSSRHSSSDLKKLIGKLRVLRERRDDELYGPLGLSAITNSIRQLEDALASGMDAEALSALYNRIDHLYANTLDAYVDGLCGWGYEDDEPCDDQTLLRIQKLRHYRDAELRKLRIAESSSANVSVSQETNQTQGTSIVIGITSTFEQIDQLPEETLSEEDRTTLKGMLGDLSTKDDKKRESKAKKLLHWLGDKGIDVAIAVLPYVAKAINPGLAG